MNGFAVENAGHIPGIVAAEWWPVIGGGIIVLMLLSIAALVRDFYLRGFSALHLTAIPLFVFVTVQLVFGSRVSDGLLELKDRYFQSQVFPAVLEHLAREEATTEDLERALPALPSDEHRVLALALYSQWHPNAAYEWVIDDANPFREQSPDLWNEFFHASPQITARMHFDQLESGLMLQDEIGRASTVIELESLLLKHPHISIEPEEIKLDTSVMSIEELLRHDSDLFSIHGLGTVE